ncbi:MAG: hypothetical protein WCO00_08435 [Rhodospirillaceae bacterium]
MISDDKRLRLVAKLLAMTQLRRISWRRRDRQPCSSAFSATADGLRFELRRAPASDYGRRAGGSLVAVEVWDEDQAGSGPLDTFTDRDRVPILDDLFELVEFNDGDSGAAAAKINAFLKEDVTHAQ